MLSLNQTKRRKYRIGLIHKHVSAVYDVRKSSIYVVALIDNRANPKFR
jgi:hypothetical protein